MAIADDPQKDDSIAENDQKPPHHEDTGPDTGDATEESAAAASIAPADDEAPVRLKSGIDLAEDRTAIRKAIITLALPALAEMILMTLVSMADLIRLPP